ncbi:MAG: Smr/MutS family protein [Comamonadaceae bacterium]
MSGKPVKVSSLAELKLVKREIEAQTLQRERQAAEAQRLKRESVVQSNLFLQAAGVVQPLPEKNRIHFKKTVPSMPVMQYQRDEKAVLKEAISDEFDSATLLDSDDQLSFRRPGIGVDVTRKLRRGDWSIQRQIDLHGLRRDEAREHLSFFIREAHKQGIRCVRVVHGKGLGSPGKAPILKSRVHSWLVQKSEVLAFVQAKPADGGAGALLVLLAPVRS